MKKRTEPTRTIEFDFDSYLVEVEATRDGRVIEATISIDHMSPADCTKQFKNSDWCMKELFKRLPDVDWSDCGDEGLDEYRDYLEKLA